MARVSTTEGGYGGGASVIHIDSSHSEYVSVPDAELLFRGDYHRAGPDLVLTGHDGHHHIIPGYFASEKHAALVAPNGATLSADVVDLLAGSPAPGQYAQAQPTAPPDSIGKVEKVVGDVTVVRNGVSVALHVGDAVFKSDVIATGGDSSAGITFPDGTVLDLVANSRMALNEYSFEPNGANNGAVFTLVEGTFGFVAGQVAHDNHMSVVTPVATMGIRGTAGIVRHEFRANAGDLIYSFLVLDEIDIRRHGHHVGSYEVRDNRPDSPTFGEILRYIADSGYVTYVEPQGSGLPPIVTTEPITNSRLFSDRPILQDLVDSYGQFNGPGGVHGPGSGDNPNLLFGPQLFEDNNGQPLFINLVPPSPGGQAPPVITVFSVPPAPNPPPPIVPGPSSNIFIWNGGPGTYPTQNWSQPGVPNSPGDIVEILSGTVVYPAGDNFIIGELIIGPGATLDMQGGTLTVLGAVLDSGMIIVEGDPPTLTITGPTTVMSGGGFTATGSGDEIEFVGNVFNSGSLTASAGGELLFDATVVNEPGSTRDSVGKIISTGTGSTVDLEGAVFNFGTIAATHGGKIVFNGGNVVNEPAGMDQVDGRIVSRGRGSEIDFTNDSVDNFGVILATHHGKIEFDSSALTNEAGAVIKASGRGSQIELEAGSLDNFGFMAALDHGTIRLENTQFDNEAGATILAADGGKIFISDLQSGSRNDGLVEAIDGGKIFLNVGGGGGAGAGLNAGGDNGGNFGEIKSIGRHSTIDIRANGGSFDNQDGGTVLALLGGKISLEGDVDNHAGAKIEAIGCDSRVVFSDGNLDNAGFIAAKHDGIIQLFGVQVTNEDGAKILADHGTITFAGGGVDNQSGAKIEAKDHGSIAFISTHDNSIEVDNDSGGKIIAKDYGSITFKGVGLFNDAGATIEAKDHGIIKFIETEDGPGGIENAGTIEAKFGGVVDVSHSTITQGCDGVLAATGCNSQINLDHATVVGGTLETSCGGLIQTTCGDSVFDGVTIACGSNVLVNDQTSLTLQDTIDNHGTITLAAAPDPSLVIDGCVTLTGHGEIVLSGDGDNIIGGACGGVLDNVDNTISGAGSIGDGQVTLINESCGVIDANLAGQTLTIDTGNAVINKGTLEASNGGTLLVDDAVTGGGSALVAGGVVHFEQAANISEITFNNGGDTPTYGEVIFDDPNGLNATVKGFAGTVPEDLTHSDGIDLAGVWTVKWEPSGANLVLELQDGKEVATLTFDNFNGSLTIGSDGNGGTLITDPPTALHGPSPTDSGGAIINVGLSLANDQINLASAQTETQSVGGSVTYGGPGNDNFVFHPGMGADTIANFNPQADTIELEHFANVQNVQQLAALIGPDAHGDAVIELGHNDSITLPGVTQSYLQAHLQSLVHLG